MVKNALPGFLLLSGNMDPESKALAATGTAGAQAGPPSGVAGHVIWDLRGEATPSILYFSRRGERRDWAEMI